MPVRSLPARRLPARLLLPAIALATVLAACGGADTPAPSANATRVRQGQTVDPETAYWFSPGLRANYTVTVANGKLTITDNVGEMPVRSGPVPKRVIFADSMLAFDPDGAPGQAYRIYQAAFDRKPDAAGLGYWITAMNNGASVFEVAAAFVASDEFKTLYGNAPSNRAMVTQFYRNVLHRAPDQAGLDYWVDVLDRGAATPAAVLASFSEGPENKQQVAGAIANGIAYTPYPGFSYSPDDAFLSAGGELDTCRWFDWSAGGATAGWNNGLTLQTSATASPSLGKIVSQFSVRDDFSVEINVNVDDAFEQAIPGNAQKYAGIGVQVDSQNYALLSLAREGTRTVIKPLVARSGVFDNLPVAAISGRSARLRIASSGGTLSFGYWNADNTALIPLGGTARLGDGEYQVTINANTIGVQQAFTATFGNFQAGSGSTTSFRPYIRGPLATRSGFMTGGVIEGYPYDKFLGADNWGNTDMYAVLAANGMQWQRVAVTTQSIAALRNTPVSNWKSLPWDGNYWQSQEVVDEMLRLGQNQGINPLLVFYFSDIAANSGNQNAPAAWKGLSVEETAKRLRQHTHDVAAAYKAKGYNISVYELGNEIDSGILNFTAGDRIPLPASGDPVGDLAYMRDKVWSVEATLLKAAAEGVQSVNPNAKFVLHAAMTGVTPSDVYVKAFYKAMKDFGVPYDIAGLSIPYPQGQWNVHRYSQQCWFQRLQETTDYIARIGKQSMISEASYASSTAGTVAAPMQGFPYTEAGQTGWVREYLRFANNNPNMAGFMYFYPDWYAGRSRNDPGTLVLDSYGLFYPDKTAKPALKAFKLPLVSAP